MGRRERRQPVERTLGQGVERARAHGAGPERDEADLRDRGAVPDDAHEEVHRGLVADLRRHVPDAEVPARCGDLRDLLDLGAEVLVRARGQLLAHLGDQGPGPALGQRADGLGQPELGGQPLGLGDQEGAGDVVAERRRAEVGVVTAGGGDVVHGPARLGAHPGPGDPRDRGQVHLGQHAGHLAHRQRRDDREPGPARAGAGVGEVAQPGDGRGQHPGGGAEVRGTGALHPAHGGGGQLTGPGDADRHRGHRRVPVAQHQQRRLVAHVADPAGGQQLGALVRAPGVPAERAGVGAPGPRGCPGHLDRLVGRHLRSPLARPGVERAEQRRGALAVGVPGLLAGQDDAVARGVVVGAADRPVRGAHEGADRLRGEHRVGGERLLRRLRVRACPGPVRPSACRGRATGSGARPRCR